MEEFGFSVPLTTDELIAQYEIVCPEKEGKPTPIKKDVYPMTYAGSNSAGYWMYMYDTLFAQYSGVEKENTFWNIPATADGYKIYEDEGILKSLEVMSKVVDDNYCMKGTATLSNEASQAKVLKGNALYMCTGNWVYNEMKLNYSTYVDNMEMIKMPIISALGQKLGFENDKVLSNIVKGIDDGKTDSQIAMENSIEENKVAVVRDARNVYFDASVDHVAIIPSYSQSKEVAKLFLRFMASDDNLDLYKQKTNSSLPFNYATESKVTPNAYVSSVDRVSGTASAVMITEDLYSSPIRQQHLLCFGDLPYATVFLDMSQKSNGEPRKSANDIYSYVTNYVSNNWSRYLRMAGIN